MPLERLLQINMAALAALGTLLLGMGQRSAAMPLLMLLAAAASVWLTDVQRRFHLNRTVAGIAGLLAMLLCLSQTLRFEREALLPAVGYLLVFLQVTQLFQQKDERVYWHMIILSLSQAVLATLFNQGVWFGVLLVLDMLCGLSALAWLLLLRQWRRFPAVVPGPRPTAPGRRWPLAGAEAEFASRPAGALRAGLVRQLFIRLGLMGLGTLALTLLLFFAVPRFGQTAWRGAMIGQRQVVGFGETVMLGELGTTIESREEVLRVQLVDPATAEPFAVCDGVYLRGTVLTHYGQRGRGQWSCPPDPSGQLRPLEPVRLREGEALVRQRIEVQPLDRRELFCLWPFVPLEPNAAIRFDSRTQRLVRSAEESGHLFRFELGTTAIVDGVQVPLVPWNEPGTEVPSKRWSELVANKQLLQLPDLPRLRALARQWDEESRLPAADRIGRARFVEAKLCDSGLFQYSLEGQPRNEELDPIEDFVSEHPVGHCEYFATALALMLRSRGIPARVVLGYRGDEFNEAGKFYQVRQLHAHAWVEAYLAPEHLPPERFRGEDHWQWSAGAWLRLDATPGDIAGGRPAEGGLFGPLVRAYHWIEDLWTNYIMELDRQRQREAIYQPLLDGLRAAWHRLGNPDWWRGLFARAGEWLHLSAADEHSGWWLATVAIVLLGLAVLAAFWLLRRCGRRWLLGRSRPRRSTTPAAFSAIDFYRRLESLLARHGLVRPPGQTQREFATAAGLRLAAAGWPQLAPLPGQMVEAFYRVRFGHVPLDTAQAKAVEQALAKLGDCPL